MFGLKLFCQAKSICAMVMAWPLACLFCMRAAAGHRPLLSLYLILTGQARGKIMCQLIKTQGSAAESITLDKWLHLDMHYSGMVRAKSCFTNVLMDLQTCDAEFPDTSTAAVHFLLLICHICVAEFNSESVIWTQSLPASALLLASLLMGHK